MALAFAALAVARGALASTPEALSRIEQAKGVVAVDLGSNDIKLLQSRTMRRTAFTLGVQGGAHWRYQKIDRALTRESAQLDQIFNFAPLLLDNLRVLPPVIESVRGAVRLNSDIAGSSIMTAYRIEAPARLVSTPPSWRSYLIQDFPPLTRVSRLLLPRTRQQKRVWKQAVRKGWAVGVGEANAVFSSRLHELQRDYLGILRFHALAIQKMVSVPVLATGDLGIKVNGKSLSIGQKVFRITWPAHFERPAHWRVVGVKSGR